MCSLAWRWSCCGGWWQWCWDSATIEISLKTLQFVVVDCWAIRNLSWGHSEGAFGSWPKDQILLFLFWTWDLLSGTGVVLFDPFLWGSGCKISHMVGWWQCWSTMLGQWSSEKTTWIHTAFSISVANSLKASPSVAGLGSLGLTWSDGISLHIILFTFFYFCFVLSLTHTPKNPHTCSFSLPYLTPACLPPLSQSICLYFSMPWPHKGVHIFNTFFLSLSCIGKKSLITVPFKEFAVSLFNFNNTVKKCPVTLTKLISLLCCSQWQLWGWLGI